MCVCGCMYLCIYIYKYINIYIYIYILTISALESTSHFVLFKLISFFDKYIA